MTSRKIQNFLLGVVVWGTIGGAIAGAALYVRSLPPASPKFDDFISQDQAFAEMCCQGDDQCLDDLHVKLSGCLAEHGKDGTWGLCQYQYMEQLGIKPPKRNAAGILEDGNPQPTAEQLRQELDQLSPPTNPADMAKWRMPGLPAYMAGVCKGVRAP
jgi:hypothetical protein